MEIFLFLYITATLWAIISIILYGNRPARSIAWMFMVIVFPIFGVLFYIMFGINRKQFKFFTLNNLSKRRLYDINNKQEIIEEFKHKFEKHRFEKLGKLMFKSSGFPAIDGNDAELLEDGKLTFKTIFKTLREAKSFIHIQYYIFEQGEILDELCEIIDKKLNEGVEVRLMYDAFGSFRWKTNTVKALEKKGLKCFSILPINFKTILSTINYRNHRKLVIVDGKIAFTGGVNVTDKYINSENDKLGIWDDLHLKIKGPAVDHLHRIFIKDYFFASNESLLTDEKYLPHLESQGNFALQVISGGPDLDYSSILHQYVMMTHSAEKSILIQNPYFIPNKMLLEALKMAALRGVEVRLLVPKHIDSKIAKYSMHSNFEELLKAGIKICVADNAFFHSKLMIIDNTIASIGSGNFDYRSFEHNYELNILIYNKELSVKLAKDYENQCKTSNELSYKSFKERPVKEKLLQGAAKIFSPLL